MSLPAPASISAAIRPAGPPPMMATRMGRGVTAGFKKDFRLLFIQELLVKASISPDAYLNAKKA
jgi:hypothetical protein